MNRQLCGRGSSNGVLEKSTEMQRSAAESRSPKVAWRGRWRTPHVADLVLALCCLPLLSCYTQHPSNTFSHISQSQLVPGEIARSRPRRQSLSFRPFRAQLAATSDNNIEDEQVEWKAVLAAFQMYKAAFGDLKIPLRFVVPNMAPWPKAAWGCKLGKIVGSIRSTGKYIQNQPQRRDQIEKLGFVWRARSMDETSPSLEQLYQALQAFRQIEQPQGSLHVPTNYVVPETEPWPENVRGLPLGQHMSNLPLVLSENPKWKAAFAKLGVTAEDDRQREDEEAKPTANDVRFHNVYLALQTYRETYGDLLVPQPFVVPESGDWPKDTWGLRLGARVNAIRSQGTFVNADPERREMLDQLGFAWSPPKERRRRRTGSIIASGVAPTPAVPYPWQDDNEPAETDSLFDGSFDFARDFDLDNDGDKSSPTWGLEEGGKRELQEHARKAEAAAQAADEYKSPSNLAESLREATIRAKEVGIVESLTDRNRVVKGKQEKDIPWFNDDFGDDFVFEDVVEALTVYKSLHGGLTSLTVDEEFVVPTPVEKTGFLDDDDDDELDSSNFDSSARAAQALANFDEGDDEDLVAAEIGRLQQEVGDSNVATEVRRPKPAKLTSLEAWPEYLAGMRLGSISARIRDGSLEVKHIAERKAELDGIGFDWGDPKIYIDVPFEKAMCAMYAYFLVRGDMFVYEDFVMPDEDPWPKALAGYTIGKDVKRIRELQNYFEAYHAEKVTLLRMIDFVWFPTTALSLNPNESEETDEFVLLNALGHPDYAKMIDIPMGLPDKIIAHGPFFDSDDPKHWWRTWHNWDYVKDYWYTLGRRDNAYVLRGMGYSRMAEEHEEKYGPGLFQQIDETMQQVGEDISALSLDEKKEVLEKLNHYRLEMVGCEDIHPESRNELISNLDEAMLSIMKDANLDMESQDAINGVAVNGEAMPAGGEAPSANGEVAREYAGEGVRDYASRDEDDAEDEEEEVDEDYELEEYDFEDELGFGDER